MLLARLAIYLLDAVAKLGIFKSSRVEMMKASKAVVNDTRAEVSISSWGADKREKPRSQVRIAINSERAQKPKMITWHPDAVVCDTHAIVEIGDSDYRSVYFPCEPFETAAAENTVMEAVA